MKRRWVELTVALSIVSARISPALAQETAASNDVARAESYAAEAFEAYNRKDYTEAVVLYMKALEASPSADILYNLAKIYDTKLKDRELAMKFYRRYIADPGAEPERVRQANSRLAELRELETAASAPAPAAGGKAGPKTADAAGEARKLPPDQGAGLSTLQIAGLVTGLVGIGSLAVGTVFGLAAKSDADTAKELCNGNDCVDQSGVEAAKDASKKATISTVSFVAGGALTVVGAVLLVSGSRTTPEHDTAGLSFTPYFGPGSLGTNVSGRW